MVSKVDRVGPEYFEQRLISYIREYHPRMCQRRRFIEKRCLMASDIYQNALAAGYGEREAVRQADEVLYDGLYFSEYELILTTVSTEFAGIPTHMTRRLAYDLMPICEYIFRPYRPFDRKISEKLRNNLSQAVSKEIRSYANECGYLLKSF